MRMEYIVLGYVLGYSFGSFIGGKHEGEKGRIHFDWWLKNTHIHIHHWMVCIIILMLYKSYLP